MLTKYFCRFYIGKPNVYSQLATELKVTSDISAGKKSKLFFLHLLSLRHNLPRLQPVSSRHTVNPITSLFGSSPFKPLQSHMRIVRDCVAQVPELFDALIARDEARLMQQKDNIFAKERAADVLRNQLSSHLPKSLFMPVDRRDLLDMLNMQDAIADMAQDIAGLVSSRRMQVPQVMAEPLQAFVLRCVDACYEAATIIEELDSLVETGFRGQEVSKVETMIRSLQQIESETDQMGVALSQQVLAIENTLNPVDAIFWYQLLAWIGDLADYAEKVGERMGLLLAR